MNVLIGGVFHAEGSALRCLEDVEGFLRNLADAAGPVAKRMALAKMRPKIELIVAKMGLTWEDTKPALEKVRALTRRGRRRSHGL